MKILVTGGAGFIGSHLTRRLVRDGHDVRILDNFSTGQRESLGDLAREVEIVRGDVRDTDAVRAAMAGVEVVFHHAAIASVEASTRDPRATMDAGVTGTLNVLEAAASGESRRVVFASSSSVYGDAPGQPKREGSVTKPLSPYAISKLAGEQLAEVFWQTRGLETVSLRYFNVYGPGQSPESEYAAVIPRFVHLLASGVQPTIFGDGGQTRDFVHIDDVVEANLLAASVRDAVGKVFNIASGTATSINEMLACVAELIGVMARPAFEPAREGDIRHSLADISLAHEVLGFAPAISIRDGLGATIGQGMDVVPSMS